MSLYARAASSASHRHAKVSEGRRASRGPNFFCLRAVLRPELLRWGQPTCKVARGLAVVRLPARGSLLSRPCLIRKRETAMQLRLRAGWRADPLWTCSARALPHPGALPLQRSLAMLRAQVTFVGMLCLFAFVKLVPAGIVALSRQSSLFDTAQSLPHSARVARSRSWLRGQALNYNPTRSP